MPISPEMSSNPNRLPDTIAEREIALSTFENIERGAKSSFELADIFHYKPDTIVIINEPEDANRLVPVPFHSRIVVPTRVGQSQLQQIMEGDKVIALTANPDKAIKYLKHQASSQNKEYAA